MPIDNCGRESEIRSISAPGQFRRDYLHRPGSNFEKIRGRDTSNGSLCDEPNKVYPPVQYMKKSADFDTYKEAVAGKAGKVEPG